MMKGTLRSVSIDWVSRRTQLSDDFWESLIPLTQNLFLIILNGIKRQPSVWLDTNLISLLRNKKRNSYKTFSSLCALPLWYLIYSGFCHRLVTVDINEFNRSLFQLKSCFKTEDSAAQSVRNGFREGAFFMLPLFPDWCIRFIWLYGKS